MTIREKKEFFDIDEAKKFVDAYLKEYHPAGYGTDVKITIEISRLASCE